MATPPSDVSLASDPKTKKLILYSNWLSSCAWRVRIALNLKGLPYEYKAVNLHKGEQFSEEFTKINPLQFTPALADGDEIFSDSLAIILPVGKTSTLHPTGHKLQSQWLKLNSVRKIPILWSEHGRNKILKLDVNPPDTAAYLEDKYPDHPLLPKDTHSKAISLQAAAVVASSIQPFQNMFVVNLIEEKLGAEEKLKWGQLFIERGFTALEKLLKDVAGRYSVGDEVSLADIFLCPQISNAESYYNVDMKKFPTLLRIGQALAELPEFQAAHPDRQPDAGL